ncbi:hypothetical protein BKA82DRAFT_22008 [Pisolithus tinctorius]|uniref:Uncharacterized protein n=1 Tax=Pisolithus tinctorius Marx 270 TaxID=870435 RepID=A0A0C3P7U0_PISTI|nr:hypothetical protein BKA82DRAFT_22008 [Pisolithus tinctorius]KIO09500.1 hypothetical protein M404DRAFT_22008 [Pisolithus tinctorius Marx 270]
MVRFENGCPPWVPPSLAAPPAPSSESSAYERVFCAIDRCTLSHVQVGARQGTLTSSLVIQTIRSRLLVKATDHQRIRAGARWSILTSSPAIQMIHSRPVLLLNRMTDHRSHFTPSFSFQHQFRDVETTSPIDPHEAPYPYLGGSQPNQPIGYKPYQGNGNGRERTTPVYSSRSVRSQSITHGHGEALVQDDMYAPNRSRSGSFVPDLHSYDREPMRGYEREPMHSLQATVAQIMVDIRNLTEGKMHLEEELTRLREDNKTVTSRLDTLEQNFAELQEKGEVALKQASSRMSSNDHTAVKSIIQPLFCQLCGIDCSRSKKVRVAALAAVKPLDGGEPLELTAEGVEIWHPNWLGQVDDKLNAKFIEEVAERVYNNEKSQRELTQVKNIPDKSFNLLIITECAKTYFRSIHKRASELQTEQGVRKAKQRLEYGRQRARCSTVTAVRRKAALQYEQDSGHKGAAALIETDLGSDVLTCNDSDVSEDTLERRKLVEVGKSANKVVGHAWRSIDYVAFLRWLSFHALKQQQDVNEPSSGSMRSVDDEPQRKRRKTTKKFHKRVFDVSPKHLNHNPPQPKATIFKPMVDETWRAKNPNVEVVEGVDWLKGFYSRLRQGEIFDADATYLKELKEWLEAGMCTSSESEDDTVET